MLKKITYILLAMMFCPQISYADIEAIQGAVVGPIKKGIKTAQSIQDELNQIQEDMRNLAGGITGPIKDAVSTANSIKNEAQSNIDAAKGKIDAAQNFANNPEGSLSTLGSSMPGFATKIDMNDSQALSASVQTNYFMQRPKSSSNTSSSETDSNETSTEDANVTALYQAQEEKMNEIQRENFAKLYATAFSIRANLAKEESEDSKKENTRDIIQSTKTKSMEMAKRFRKIMLMETMLFEFNATQQARQFSYAEEDS